MATRGTNDNQEWWCGDCKKFTTHKIVDTSYWSDKTPRRRYFRNRVCKVCEGEPTVTVEMDWRELANFEEAYKRLTSELATLRKKVKELAEF
jgi:hypothetical protein